MDINFVKKLRRKIETVFIGKPSQENRQMYGLQICCNYKGISVILLRMPARNLLFSVSTLFCENLPLPMIGNVL